MAPAAQPTAFNDGASKSRHLAWHALYSVPSAAKGLQNLLSSISEPVVASTMAFRINVQVSIHGRHKLTEASTRFKEAQISTLISSSAMSTESSGHLGRGKACNPCRYVSKSLPRL